ncbi:zinc-RING finger and ankyrin repeat domain-containing protein rolling pebbles isoform X2 [Choristoneura fumiferana]|uniref:zinc-RING finger and ankyrin repeat domain-containing protein rolling pebbles isoform X2 n=1 Tax=Choristoneura fumiferana TaxID=7141 RepID=UPI003D15B1F6
MYSSNEFLHSAGVTRHMQATGEAPSQKTSMKRRSCEVPLGDISYNNFKISLGDITNADDDTNYDCRSLRSVKSNQEDTRSMRYYRPIDSRSVKNFRSSLADISTCSLSRPPSYDQLSRRSVVEGPEAGFTSSIEGVLWSDEEENEYFYHENITTAWNQDLAAIRQLLESETGGTNCPSCNMPFDKGKKRKLIDTCGHERCYACMFRNEACPICARNSQGRRPAMERYTPSPQRQDDWQSPMRLPKPPKQPTNLVQSCPTPPHTRRRFFLSPKSLRSPFAQRASRHSSENHVPLSDDEGGHIKQGFERRQNDLYMRLGLLLGERRSRNKARDSCTSLASLDAHTLASHNTSPVSTLTGSSEVEAATPLGRDSLGSLASMSLSAASNCSSSSPGSRRHSVNTLQNGRSEELTRMSSGFFKNRKTAARRSARVSSKQSSTSSENKKVHPSPQLTLRPLFFEVPSTDNQGCFSGRQWLMRDMEKALESSSSGILISGSPGTGKTALILQLVQYSCFGRKRNYDYEELREQSDIREVLPEELTAGMCTHLASHVVAYHFCQADNNSTCLVGEFVHSLAAQLCQAPRLQSYREYLLSEPHLLGCLSLKECIADPDLAFMRGIIEPLIILRRNGSIDRSNSIILIDGLCEAEYHRPDHGHTIASFLAKHITEMPSWLKVVATVRTQFIELTKQLPYSRLSLDESDNVHKDLLEYFNMRVQNAPIIETNIKCSTGKMEGVHNSVMKFAQYVLHLSQGSFLFLKLILDLLERSHIVVKSTNYKVVPISLAQIFLLQFNLRFPTVQSFEKVTHILSVCLAALYPLTLVEIYYSVNSLLVDKFLPWDEFCHRFDSLADFLVKRIDNTYMFFHPSFREWLMRREDNESPKFLCDLRAGHCGIAFRLARVQAPLDPEKSMELGHHILKAHMYRNLGPAQLGLCPRDLQANLVATSSANVGESIANLRNIYTPNVKVSRLMLLAGGSPNQITDCLGNAPLLCMYAYQGILSMVGLLLEFGADLEMTNSQGCTALSLACQRGHTDVARRLIATGASLSHTDTAEQTPLVHAAKNGHRDTVIYLLGCQTGRDDRSPLDFDDNIEQMVPGSRHALIGAAQNGHLDIVEYLLDTAELIPDGICPVTGETALTAACSTGNAAIADALLIRGATPYSLNARQLSPLALAAKNGRTALVLRLLDSGADVMGSGGKIPLILAAAEGHADVIEMLLENGADPDAVDADGISALGWACLRSRIPTVVTLIDKGATIDQPDGSGRTPLGLACGGSAELVEILLEKGASLEKVDHSGLRPLDRAIGQRNVPVVNCFLRKGAKLGPTTWVMASGKPEFMLILLNKLLEDGNMLYRKNRPSEAAHRYQYALKKVNPLISDEGLTTPATPVPHEHISAFVQLKTNLLLNLSRCKRKLNEPSEALDLAARASVLRPNAFECAYAMARAILALNKPSEALPHARRALLLAPSSDLPTVRTLKALQSEILSRINAGTHSLNGDNRSLRNFDTISLNMP